MKPNSSKYWRWSYRYDGKQKAMAFGSYPAISLADARAKRDEAFAILSEGRDPAIAKKLKIEARLEAARQTFERTARAWHENAKWQWAKRHANDVLRSLQRDVFPALGNLRSPRSRRRSCLLRSAAIGSMATVVAARSGGPVRVSTDPRSRSNAASVLLRAPRVARDRAMWVSAVRGEMPRCLAISL